MSKYAKKEPALSPFTAFPYHHTQRIKRVKKPKRLLWICTHMHMKQLVTKILIPGSQSPAIGMRTAQTPYRWTIGGQDYNWTMAEGELHLLIIPILSLGQWSQNLKIWNRPHKHSLPKCTPAIYTGRKQRKLSVLGDCWGGGWWGSLLVTADSSTLHKWLNSQQKVPTLNRVIYTLQHVSASHSGALTWGNKAWSSLTIHSVVQHGIQMCSTCLASTSKQRLNYTCQ